MGINRIRSAALITKVLKKLRRLFEGGTNWRIYGMFQYGRQESAESIRFCIHTIEHSKKLLFILDSPKMRLDMDGVLQVQRTSILQECHRHQA